MNYATFNRYCKSLPATTYVNQWGGAHVWKVGGKVFAIGGWTELDQLGITFKTTPLDFEILRGQPGLRGAPYLASRGMKWIQHYKKPGLSDKDLRYYLNQSYRLVVLGLPRKRRSELGLEIDKGSA